MKFRPIIKINRLFGNNKFLMAFSVLCAVIFWLIIDISENPVKEVIISDITVAVTNQTDDEGKQLMVTGETEHDVSVTVSGPRYIVSRVNKSDIIVSVVSYADVDKPGDYELKLTASVNVSGCQISKITPSTVKVNYDYNTEAAIPVEVDVSGFKQHLQADREINGVLRSNADGSDITALSVKGPAEVIGTISKVVVVPTLPDEILPETQNLQEISFKFLDKDGKEVDSSQIVFNGDVYVRAIFYKVADVPLVPTFTNLPTCYSSSKNGLPSYALYAYSDKSRSNNAVTHVKVRGPVEVVDKLLVSGLRLQAIDFMQVKSGNTSFNVAFILEDGVEITDGTQEITVTLNLGNLKTTVLQIEPSQIRFIGLTEGMRASSTITNNNIKVTVCYDYSETRRVKAEDIVLTVDLSGITTPSTVKKTISMTTSDSSIFAWANSIEPADTVVEIK